MSVELVGLAYDQELTDTIWQKITVKEAYDLILNDDFRKKVDFRSMLYHKGQIDLLSELEHFLYQGGEAFSLVELLAARFAAGIEDFPNPTGEYAFDFALIRHFASLAMKDDFLIADPFFRELLKKVGFLKNDAGWSLLEVKDFNGIASALRDARMKDIIEVVQSLHGKNNSISFEHLVRNYIEFLAYSMNNNLTPFFYNSESDFRRWGDLVDRQNRRNEVIVDLSLRYPKKSCEQGIKKNPIISKTRDLQERIKLRRETDGLLGGLKDSDPLIRQKAAESLTQLAVPEILPNLEVALSDSEPQVRQEIVRAIANIGDEKSNSLLMEVLIKDEVHSVRLIAGNALRCNRVMGSLPLLLDAVKKRQPHFSTILSYHPGLCHSETVMKELKIMICDDNPLVRRDTAFIIGRLRNPLSEKMLVQIVEEDKDEETRCNALYSLWTQNVKKAKACIEHVVSPVSEKLTQAIAFIKYSPVTENG